MERHWTSPAMAAALQAVINSPQSDRLKEALKIAPRLLDSYLASAVHDANDSFICALILQLMARYSSLLPDKMFSYEVQRRLVVFMLAAFHRSPHSIALLKKPIVNRLGEAYDNPAKTELALQLCWAIEEHGGGGGAHKDAARQFLQVSRSRISDARVWKCAQDCLSLMNEPAVCMSILGPVHPSSEVKQYSCIINWDEGSTEMIAHIPFYILGVQEGPPLHDFAFGETIPKKFDVEIEVWDKSILFNFKITLFGQISL